MSARLLTIIMAYEELKKDVNDKENVDTENVDTEYVDEKDVDRDNDGDNSNNIKIPSCLFIFMK